MSKKPTDKFSISTKVIFWLFIIFIVLPVAFWKSKDFILPIIYDLTEHGVVDRSALRDKLPLEKVTELTTLSPSAKGTICAFYSYQNKNYNVEEPFKSQVSPYLKENQIMPMEGEWTYLMVDGDKATRTDYTSYKDITADHVENVVSIFKDKIPPNFDPAYCVRAEDAMLFKVMHGGRAYIILGREK